MTVEEQISQDWPADSPVQATCLRVVAGLRAIAPIDHLTFDDLIGMSDQSDMAALSQAVLYLSNSIVGALKKSLMYEVDDHLIEVTPSEMATYVREGLVVHPRSGEPLDESALFVSFQLGERLSAGATE